MNGRFRSHTTSIITTAALAALTAVVGAARAQAPAQDKKPNIMFIMGDDIGWMQPSLWEKELMSYKVFPPLQAPETYNLDGILKQVQNSAREQ